MSTEAIIFWSAGIFCVVGALMTITRRHPVASVLWLVLTFVGLAGLFVGMGAFFVAAIQVLVYAGAIMVLFLFVIMLLDVREESVLRIRAPAFRFGAIVAALGVLIGIGLVVRQAAVYAQPAGEIPLRVFGGAEGSQVKEIAARLFGKWLLPFEVTSVLLLVAVIGAVVISRRMEKGADEEATS